MHRPATKPFRTVAVTCLFLSGTAALCYEIGWVRSATQLFGATTLAVSIVIALFFLGMAAGARWFGSHASRSRQPLATYARLEIGAGLLAAASPWLLLLCEIPYRPLYAAYHQNPIPLTLVRLMLAAAIVVPPAFLMGGTLPLFTQWYETVTDGGSAGIANLYGINTLGGALGCLLGGFVLLPVIGLTGTMFLSGLAAATCGAFLLGLLTVTPTPCSPPATNAQTAAPVPDRYVSATQRWLVYGVIFGSGFTGLAAEILWTRFLALITRNTVYTYTISLFVTLVGIAAGAFLASFRKNRTDDTATLAAVQLLGALFIPATLLLPTAVWQQAAADPSPLRTVMLCSSLMLVPSILSGMAFPLLYDCTGHAGMTVGDRAGITVAVNTAGCVTGSLVAGFLLLPRLGMHRTLVVITGTSLVLGLLVLLVLDRHRPRQSRLPAALTTIALWSGILIWSPVHLPDGYLANGRQLVELVEGNSSFITVVRHHGELELEMDRLWQGQKRAGHQVLAAHLPMLLHPDARDILVVGLGAGQTPGRFLSYDIDRLDCVELEGRLPDLLSRHFSGTWLQDPRTRVITEDGIQYLRYMDRRYDLISLEAGQLFRPQVAPFYTLELYRTARQRLAPGGTVCQFVPVGFFSAEQLASVVQTFLSVFPHSSLWYNRYAELLLIGSADRDLTISTHGVAVLKGNRQAIADLFFGYPGTEEYFLNRPEVLAGSFLMGPRGLAKIAGNAPLLRADRPELEFGTARTHYDPHRFRQLFLERRESPRRIIAYTDADTVMQTAADVQEANVRNGFR